MVAGLAYTPEAAAGIAHAAAGMQPAAQLLASERRRSRPYAGMG